MTPYEESMRALIAAHGSPGHRLKVLYLIPAILLAVGAGIRYGFGVTFLGTWPTLVLGVAVLLRLAFVATRGPDRPAPQGVNWTSAYTYQQQLDLPDDAEQTIALAADRLHQDSGCYVHTYVVVEPGLPRFMAAILHGTKQSVIVVGRGLLAEPSQLAFVIVHELHHHTRWQRVSRRILTAASLQAWLVLGLLTPLGLLPIVAPAWLVTTILWRWAEELACDAAALRRDDGAAVDYFRNVQALAALQSATDRILLALTPLHPPVMLRLQLARWLTSRTGRPQPGRR